jgi:hypothetical protein
MLYSETAERVAVANQEEVYRNNCKKVDMSAAVPNLRAGFEPRNLRGGEQMGN